MKTAVILLNFGEPENATMDEVVPFLERIFSLNSGLEDATAGAAQTRARALAEARAPDLIEEYRLIGGSPLHAQAQRQGQLLQAELRQRGHDVVAINGMQFTRPFIVDAVRQARAAGVERIVGLPVYPLCGPSTNVAALQRLQDDVAQQNWAVPIYPISGWHRHPGYIELRAETIRSTMREHGLTFDDGRTKLVFSAHGTPTKYVEEGSRYVVYVEDFCSALAEAVDAPGSVIGYQNHTNRPIEWTQPDIDQVVERIDADTIIVDPVSFMHEQSETLAELDHELRETAEARGLRFVRVPIPYADAAFISVLADLVEPVLHPALQPGNCPAGPVGAAAEWHSCRCKPGALCLNAAVPAGTAGGSSISG